MIKNITLLLLAVLIVSSLFTGTTAHAVTASDWKSGRIIDDSIFVNKNDMTVDQIQAYLNSKVGTGSNGVAGQCDTNGTRTSELGGGTRAQYGASHGNPAPFTCLKDYYEVPKASPGPGIPANNYGGLAIPSGARSAAQLIWDAAQRYGINPKVLLVKLHTESAGPLTIDDWPLQKQYTYAMGAHCPDSGPGGSANCDSNYSGFSIQISEAAALLRYYLDNMNQSWWPYKKPFQNNNILWNVTQSNCGSSNVYIESYATAALYTYTPYQPNQAALNNMYGTGDGCSAYGNRNFWRVFNDWFGSSRGGITLAKSNNSPTVFVIYGGQKQAIPSGDVLTAWGLDSLPVNIMDTSSIDPLPTRGVLTRTAKNPYNSDQFLLADNGGTFDALAPMLSNWSIDPASVSQIGPELISYTRRLGSLSQFVAYPGATGMYAVDSGSTRQFGSGTFLQGWAGSTPIATISSALFNSLPTGAGIFSNSAVAPSGNYLASNGSVFSLSTALAPVYPTTGTTTFSDRFINTLASSGPISRFIKGSGNTIYLVDNGQKHAFATGALLSSYMGKDRVVSALDDSVVAQIPDGLSIFTRFAYNPANTAQQYYINSDVNTLPTFYNANSYGFGISQNGINLIDSQLDATSCAGGFVQAQGNPTVYLIDSGERRGITSLDSLTMLMSPGASICSLPSEDIQAIPANGVARPFVSNSGLNYVIDQGKLYTVLTPAIMPNVSFSPVSNSFIARFSQTTTLEKNFTVNGVSTTIDNGSYYQTNSARVALIWANNYTSQSHSAALLGSFTNKGALNLFASGMPGSAYGGTIFVVGNDKLWGLRTIEEAVNLGFNGIFTQISDTKIASMLSANAWHGYLSEDDGGGLWLLDAGVRRSVPEGYVAAWKGSSVPSKLGNPLLAAIPIGSPVGTAIKSGSPTIYGVRDGKRFAFTTPSSLASSNLPAVVTLSNNLLVTIPSGGIW